MPQGSAFRQVHVPVWQTAVSGHGGVLGNGSSVILDQDLGNCSDGRHHRTAFGQSHCACSDGSHHRTVSDLQQLNRLDSRFLRFVVVEEEGPKLTGKQQVRAWHLSEF